MSYLEERVIGPTLGADSIRSGVLASLAGLVLVVLFMLVYYKLSGINAIVAMVCNLVDPARPDGLLRRGDDAARASPASS